MQNLKKVQFPSDKPNNIFYTSANYNLSNNRNFMTKQWDIDHMRSGE